LEVIVLLLNTIEISEKALTEKSFLLLAPRSCLRRVANELTARLAAKGDVFVFDGGNSFDAYGTIRMMTRRSKSQLAFICRAFTLRALLLAIRP
jgi:hypothetical protein